LLTVNNGPNRKVPYLIRLLLQNYGAKEMALGDTFPREAVSDALYV
jgi:hypothetical protein